MIALSRVGQALYRKYRSKKLSEIVGQEHITTALDNALKTGKLSHAYLFTGPKGVGKTSIARILAHEVNNLPYDDETTHLDIIEIDAASNRRIDEIRDIREKVHIAPSSGTYKVYIIDEVHMLTREAFNALLKTLEEPPAHVIFILATTEAHKLPETIISRTQRFTFKPVDEEQVVRHLRTIAKTEGITIDDAALKLIAKHGDGSFRDSIGLLDQAASSGEELGLPTVQKMLGIAPKEAIDQLLVCLGGNDSAALLSLLAELYAQGLSGGVLARQLSTEVRAQLVGGVSSMPAPEALTLLRHLLDVTASSQADRLLEITLLELVLAHGQNKQPTVAPIVSPVARPTAPRPPQPKPVAKPELPQPESIQEAKPTQSKAPSKSHKQFDLTDWPALLGAVKAQHSTLYSLLRMGQPSLEGNSLKLAFRFGFHQKQLKEAANQHKLVEILAKFTDQPMKIETFVQADLPETASPKVQEAPPAPPAEIDTISNIFGGAEVLES